MAAPTLSVQQRECADKVCDGILDQKPHAVENQLRSLLAIGVPSDLNFFASTVKSRLVEKIQDKLGIYCKDEYSPSYLSYIYSEAAKKFAEGLEMLQLPGKAFPSETTMPLLALDQLPKLTKEELLTEIHNMANLMAPGTFTAFTAPLDSEIMEIGDIHAGIEQIISAINLMRKHDRFEAHNPWKLKDKYFLVFTGDIADRGRNGLAVWQIIMKLKQNNPSHVFVLRGNHEIHSVSLTIEQPFIDELTRKYPGNYRGYAIFDAFTELFNRLPIVLFLGIKQPNGTVLFGVFCHGSLDYRVGRASIKELIAESMRQENSLISKKRSDMSIAKEIETPQGTVLYTTAKPFIDANNDFLSSTGPNNFEKTLKQEGQSIEQLLINTLNSYAPPGSKVLYIAKGHYHLAGCVNKWSETKGWQIVNSQQIIEPGSLYDFMCLSEESIRYNESGNGSQIGYGLISSNGQNQLTIKPYFAFYHNMLHHMIFDPTE